MVIAGAIGFTMLFFGGSCKNAELRAKNENGTCQHIHNDDLAVALLSIGFIFVLSLWIVVFICALFIACGVFLDVLMNIENCMVPS